MYCAHCGTLVSANSRFCVSCGVRVTDPAAPTASGTLALSASGDEQLLSSVRRALATEYDVERELGRGGMAVVFQARDKELERAVALKVLPPELAPVATVADRFKREARLAASLDHPNIIPVYRVGHTGGVLYMAMKFIDGRSLDAVVADHGALPLSVILIVLRAAARALAHAHEHGIVHRDIKGANILIDRDARVVVSDFGIARAVESSTLTATGVMIGTPHFMSPEQCAGKPVGPQSDQYSLGIVAYQLLTGSVPFDGDTLPEILQHHWFTPPPDVSIARPETPAALTVAVRRLLAKEPAQRFASTNDLVVALESIPFPTTDRAAGEASLRALVAAEGGRDMPRPDSVPEIIATPPSPVQARPPMIAPARVAAPTRPLPASSDTTTVVDTGSHARAVESSPPSRSLPPVDGNAVIDERRGSALATRGAAPGSPGAVRRPAAPAKRSRPRRRWPIAVGVPLLLVVAAGIGKEVGQKRGAMLELVKGGAPAAPPRLDAATMRDAAGKAYRAGDYELARRLFVRAVALDPTDAQLHQQLGCALLKLGSADSARAEFTTSGSKPNCS